MLHQNKGRKLNVAPKHRKALLRNQVSHFILTGKLCTTVARIKEVKRIVEKVVTVAREGNHFNIIRKVKKVLPYDDKVIKKLIYEVAPQYVGVPGGYTRLVRLHNRISDTAEVGCLLWVNHKAKQEMNSAAVASEEQMSEASAQAK